MEKKMRLQKYMAKCGVASRRHAEELIKLGRVRVNGELVTEMGITVSNEDRVECDGKPIRQERFHIYIALNKPAGYVTTVTDPEGRETVMKLVRGIKERIYPVGRLDYDTTGLLLLTNDGDFAFKSTHPGQETTKTYLAEVLGIPSEALLNKIRNGIMLDDRLTSKAEVDFEKKGENAILKITLHEGRNRQVKRMCEAIGHPVLRLKRVALGRLLLGDLKPGQWRYLSEKEVKLVRGEENG